MPSVPVLPLPGLAPADPTAVASTGLSPVLLTGLLVSLLRQHFAAGDLVFNPLLRDLAWTPDAANPGRTAADAALVVESAAAWDPALAGARPSLVVAHVDWSYAKIAINNEAMGWFGPAGEVRFANTARGVHRLLAIGGTEAGDEGAHLAFEAAQFLQAAFPYVRERFSPQLMSIGVADLGAATTTIEESRSHPAVPVTIAYQVQNTWAARADAPRFRRLVLEAATVVT